MIVLDIFIVLTVNDATQQRYHTLQSAANTAAQHIAASQRTEHADIQIITGIYPHTEEDMIERSGEQLAEFFSPMISPAIEMHKMKINDTAKKIKELKKYVIKAI